MSSTVDGSVLDESEPLVSDVFTGSDPEAPYGRFKNGKPRKNPPKDGAPSPRKTRQYKSKSKTDYRPGFLGIAQMGAFVASFFSPLDAVAVTDHAPNIAEAVQVTADNDPKFAAAMDRILSAGPYAALISACVPLAMQVLHNHGHVPGEVVKTMGGRTRDEVTESLQTRESQMAA